MVPLHACHLFFVLCGSFLLVRGNSVDLNPDEPLVVYEGGTARFTAVGTADITSITWKVNDQPLDMLLGITANRIISDVDIRRLVLSNISVAYNNATIKCTAVVSGDPVLCNQVGQLGVQGILGPVENNTHEIVADSSVNISWSPPPALTVTGELGPIRYYCVEVVNLTDNIVSTIQSIGCNRSEDMNNQNSILVEDVRCGVHYNVTITPFNIVGDGQQSSLSIPGAVAVMKQMNYVQVNSTSYSYTFPVFGLVCSCSAVVDDDMELTCVVTNQNFITVNTENIGVNRKFSAVITVNNFVTPTSKSFYLTTFDVYDLTVTNSGNSMINYNITFAGGSRAIGVFVILLLQNNFDQSIYFVQRKEEAQNMNQLTLLINGNYIASAYDVEQTGVITTSAAVDNVAFTVTGQANGNLSLYQLGGINCTLINNGLEVNVTCDFNSTLYNGFTAFLQSENNFLTSTSSSETGSSVIVAASSSGTHNVFVFPIWPNSLLPSGQVKPAFERIIQLISVTSSTDSPDTSTSSSRDSCSTSLFILIFFLLFIIL